MNGSDTHSFVPCGQDWFPNQKRPIVRRSGKLRQRPNLAKRAQMASGIGKIIGSAYFTYNWI